MDSHEGISTVGARSLPADALERLRRQAVAAVEAGMPQSHVAKLFGVSRKTVGSWVHAYQADGEAAFIPRRRGRRAGERLALSVAQQAWIVKTVAGSPPDEVGLPCLLWTRKAIAEVIRRQFGLSLSGATIDQYLGRWELLDSAGPLGRPPGYPGGTLQVAWTRPRSPAGPERLHALVAVNSRGVLLFLADEQPFGAAQLAGFRKRLRVQLGREVRLLVRSWPAPYSELLDRWQETDTEVAVH